MDLQLTDEFGLSASVQLSDDSPLAKAKVTKLAALQQDLKDEVTRPLDQTTLKSFSFGLTGTVPTTTIATDTKLSLSGAACGVISIARPADKTLFPSDNFSLDVPISAGECWIGAELDVSFNAGAQLSADGFCVGIKDGADLKLTTYRLITASGGKLPNLLEGVKTALEGFYLDTTVEAVRAQPAGTVCAHEVSGTLNFSGAYQLPVTINPLASVDLPFNYTISIQPAATLKVSGSITLAGDWIVRLHKVTTTTLEIGVYKKKGTTLTAGFTAGAGISVAEGSTDLASLILSNVFSGVDATKSGIPKDNADELNAALAACIDHSLAISANVACSAQFTDEAAVIYHLDLSAGNSDEINDALNDVLLGNWTKLAGLPPATAKRLRNIVTDTTEYKHGININLFGLYNATDVSAYVQSCTILCDPLGHVSVIDKVKSSRISAAASPVLSDSDKLRTALAQDFVATAGYSVVASKVQQDLSIQQSYLRYDHALRAQKMKDAVLTGIFLRLINDKSWWDTTVAANAAFPHARVMASAEYKNAAVLNLFFADPAKRQPRSRADIEGAGRKAMIALIDPGDPGAAARLSALQTDAIWAAMDSSGNTGSFNTIPGLNHLSANDLADVVADWTDIRWWSDSMLQLAPHLATLLTLLDTLPAGNYSTNPQFLSDAKQFEKQLGNFVKSTRAAFVDGWGMAVVSALAGASSSKTMDIAWTGTTKHYESKS